METRTKEVYFSEYCKTCKYSKKKEHEDPCNLCLGRGYNIDSHKPTMWEKK